MTEADLLLGGGIAISVAALLLFLQWLSIELTRQPEKRFLDEETYRRTFGEE